MRLKSGLRIGIPVGALIMSGFVALTMNRASEDVQILSGSLGDFDLVNRSAAEAKPVFSAQSDSLLSAVCPPSNEQDIRHLGEFKVNSGAAAIIAPRFILLSTHPLPEYTYELGGIPIKVLGATGLVPYAFGTAWQTMRVKASARSAIPFPNPSADWVTLSIPPNGKPVPNPEPTLITFGRYTVEMSFIGPFVTSLPLRLRVDVLGGDPGQEFAVTVTTQNRSGAVRCTTGKPGVAIVHNRDWQAGITLEVLKRHKSKLRITTPGNVRDPGVLVTDPQGHAIYDDSIPAIEGGFRPTPLVCPTGYHAFDEEVATGLPRIRQLGSVYDAWRQVRTLGAGEFDASYFQILEHHWGQVTFDLPPSE